MKLEKIQKAISLLKKHKDTEVRGIFHLDADGICSASILAKALMRENIKFRLSVVKQITPKVISDIKEEHVDLIIFTDLGSGQKKLLNSLESDIIVLDHHPPDKEEANFIEINAFNMGLNGEKEISGAGITYLFAKELNNKNEDLVHLALVGASGDFQTRNEYIGKNKDFLEKSINLGIIKELKGLKIYGRQTRPIHKALELCTDPFIPGISNSESRTVQFLSELGIDLKEDGEWKTISDLDKKEREKLVSALLVKTLGKYKTEDLIGKIYILPMGLDIREFATLINSCGRTNNPDLGISLCLEDKMALEEAKEVTEEYREKIGLALDWIYNNLENEEKIIKKKANYILARSEIDSEIIGTVLNICLNSKILDDPLIGLAYDNDKRIKISGRVREKNINMGEIIQKAAESVDGDGGGHILAGGGYIKIGKEKRFIEEIEKQLK